MSNMCGTVYTLMCKNVPVCDVNYDVDLGVFMGVRSSFNPEWAPMRALAPNKSIALSELNYWWASRLVPAHRFPRLFQQRTVFRRLFEENCGLSLSDHYWLKPFGIDLDWHHINFFENPFDESVGRELLGTMERSSLRPGDSLTTPSVNTNGALRKYWGVSKNGTRELYKAASSRHRHEPANERAASLVMASLLSTDDFVPYRLEYVDGKPWSVCPCFTDVSREYVPAHNMFYGENELTYGPEALETVRAFGRERENSQFDEALDKMMLVDALIDNNDRHLGNFGIVRNVDTLKVERLAPIFDCGASFWAPEDERPPFAPFDENVNLQSRHISPDGWPAWLSADALLGAGAVAESALLDAGVDSREAAAAAAAVSWRAEMLLAELEQR